MFIGNKHFKANKCYCNAGKLFDEKHITDVTKYF